MGAGFEAPGHLDHRGWLWVAGILSIIYSLLCLSARAFAKWGLLWWDDIVLGVSYIFAFVNWGLIFASLTHGLGVSPSVDAHFETAARVRRAMQVAVWMRRR